MKFYLAYKILYIQKLLVKMTILNIKICTVILITLILLKHSNDSLFGAHIN